ncbi:MAG: TIGR02217 family protein, partial [Hyphomicrobiales bacterium]|nr:TIGR02217 family protein [Hyphomicrobiales bacterium]
MSAFHEVLFPLDVALGARGGPERRTDVVIVGSGAETRNARWANSRRRWDAGYGVKGIAALQAVVAFFEERRGRLTGFRWRDRLDFSSAAYGAAPAPTDQAIATGDGTTTVFQIAKTYGAAFAPYARPIRKPVAGSVVVAVAGAAQADGWTLDATTGLVTFATAPAAGAAIAAGFLF